jgi:sarcosine oxidase, subunit beta
VSRPAYDVILIGAGSAGIPAAWCMARSGLRVLVLDAGSSPGQGSHKAAIGGVRATHSEPAKIRLCLRSLEIASTWQEIHGQDIEWRAGGYSFVAYGAREEQLLKGLLTVQQRSGLSIDWLDRSELLGRVPALNPVGLRGGTFSPNDGHCSPLLLGHAIYTQACRAGAVFHFGETVTGIECVDGAVRSVTTNRRTYETPRVINVAGAWAAAIGEMVGEEHPIHPDAHEAGITEPVAPFLDPMIVDIRPDENSANCYFFQLATGQLLFSLTPRPLAHGTDCRETSGFLPLAARRMMRLVPKLARLRVRRTWRGLYPMTPDGAPLVGHSHNVDGYSVAIGLCGHGFMLGPGLGELLDRLVRDELQPEDMDVLTALRPDRSFTTHAALK